MAGTNGVTQKRETSQAKRLTAIEERVATAETRVANLEKMVAKLYSAVVGPSLQQKLEQDLVSALQRGEPLEQLQQQEQQRANIAPPQQFTPKAAAPATARR